MGLTHLILKLESDELMVEVFHIFDERAAARRSNYRTVERFKKQ